MMRKKSGIYWLLAATTLLLLFSLAAVADKTVYLPIIGKAESRNALLYKIGDTGPAGGFVFFVSSDGHHGLEAAPSDQSTGIRWYNGSYTNTEALGDGVGAGEMNTMLIIANQGSDSNSYAAGLCANYQSGGYGDWYLPSGDELNLMHNNLHLAGKGGFAIAVYWSSTEFSRLLAQFQDFSSGYVHFNNKNFTLRVRAVRAF